MSTLDFYSRRLTSRHFTAYAYQNWFEFDNGVVQDGMHVHDCMHVHVKYLLEKKLSNYLINPKLIIQVTYY